MGNVRQEVWVGWMGALVAATFVVITFAYASFETKEHAKETRDALDKRLERMEDKMDAMLEKRPYRGPARGD